MHGLDHIKAWSEKITFEIEAPARGNTVHLYPDEKWEGQARANSLCTYTYILIKSKMKSLKVGREGGRLVSNMWKYNFCIDNGSAQRLK